MTLEERIAEVRERIGAAARRAGRDPSEISLVAVSKMFPVSAIAAAADAGVTDFGENRAQDLAHKAALVGDRVHWHFVGALQRNKVRTVVGTAGLIHSVDRLEVARAISRRAEAIGTIQRVLIEVNVSGEASKAGVEPAGTRKLSEDVAALDGVELRGLMTIPPRTEDPEASRPYFERLADLRESALLSPAAASELSMGMTGDFEVAVETGATIVRIGEAIFGPRADKR